MKCPTCKRDGAEPKSILSIVLDYTLGLVLKWPGKTAPELTKEDWKYSNNLEPAMNNRLERLRKLGLVRRERDGRSWRYFAIKQ